MKLAFSQLFFKQNISNTKFHENSSIGGQVVPCGQTSGRTGRPDESNSHFSQFYEHA